METPKETVLCRDLGVIDYAECWALQQRLFDGLLEAKARHDGQAAQYLLLCEHPAVYTLGKSGHAENMLVTEDFLKAQGASFYHIDRGGDITFHGPGQLVGYPILDLEKEGIGLREYIHSIEESIIRTVADYGIMGIELMSELGSGIQFVDPLQVYAPKRNVRVNLANPAAAFNKSYLHSPGVVFIVNQQKYDARYILTSLDFARKLFGYRTEVSAIELKLKPGYDTGRAQQEIQDILGDRYRVQDRYEQQADVFRIMKIEKLISYLFLTFILVIACFNVIGSLSMLILDKREDVETLRNLGADERLIARIFLFEGRLIATFGAIAGIAGGLLLCFLQQAFGLITLGGGNGAFLVEAYPVSVHATDVLLVFATVIAVGFLSVWYPVRYLSKKLL